MNFAKLRLLMITLLFASLGQNTHTMFFQKFPDSFSKKFANPAEAEATVRKEIAANADKNPKDLINNWTNFVVTYNIQTPYLLGALSKVKSSMP